MNTLRDSQDFSIIVRCFVLAVHKGERMFRSWSQRLFGGVCSGLAQQTRINAWFWRWLLVLLTLVTGGWGVLVYILGWWLLPLQNPNQRTQTSFINTVLFLGLSVLVVVGYFIRDSLVVDTSPSLYPAIVMIGMALVFFYRQFFVNRGNLAWGALALAITIVYLLTLLNVLPTGVSDILVRSTGGVLVFLGLSVILRDRMQAGSWVALMIAVMLTGIIGVIAYSSRINEVRTENEVRQSYPIAESATTLVVNLNSLATEVSVFSAPANQRTISFTFVGARATEIQQMYIEDGALATLNIAETLPEGLIPLDSVGRGTLQIEIPQDIAVAINFAGQIGDVSFDMADLDLERLNVSLEQGDAIVTLPLYQPLSPSVAEDPGNIFLRSGSLTMVAPPELGTQFLLNKATNQRPTFDDLVYALEDNLNDWLLVSRQFDDSETKVFYIINVPSGQIRLVTENENIQGS
jgi:phage shock protein C